MTGLILSQNTATITMTSLEMVDYINSQRKDGEAELLHKNFLAKVPQVLGEETSAKFSADLPDSYGRLRMGYRFHKREACLMAMSYSYDIQAKVFDRMTELEAQIAKPALPDFTNPVLAARAWADEMEKRLLIEQENKALESQKATLEAQIEADAPKVTLAEEISADERSAITIREAAKILGFKEKDVREKARQLHYIFRNPRGQWEVYANTLRQGLMATKAEYINGMLFSVPCFTPRGLSEVRVGMGYGDLFKRIKRSMVTA